MLLLLVALVFFTDQGMSAYNLTLLLPYKIYINILLEDHCHVLLKSTILKPGMADKSVLHVSSKPTKAS